MATSGLTPSLHLMVILGTHMGSPRTPLSPQGPLLSPWGTPTVTLGSQWQAEVPWQSPQGPTRSSWRPTQSPHGLRQTSWGLTWSPQGPTQSPWGPTLVTYTATKWALAVTIRSHMAATKPHKPSFGHWGVLHGHLRVPQGPSVSPWIRPSRHAASSGPPSTAIAANLFSAASLAQ